METGNTNLPANTNNRRKGKIYLTLLILAGIFSFMLLVTGVKGIFQNSTPTEMPVRTEFMSDEDYSKSLEMHEMVVDIKKNYFSFSIKALILGILAMGFTIYGMGNVIEKYLPMESLSFKDIIPRKPESHAMAFAKLLAVDMVYIVGLGLNVIGAWLLIFITMRSTQRVVKRMILSFFLFPIIIMLFILFPFMWVTKFSKTVTIFCMKLEDIYFPFVEEFSIKKAV